MDFEKLENLNKRKIVFVGGISVGKSTIINKILNNELLKTSVEVQSTVPIYIRYKPTSTITYQIECSEYLQEKFEILLGHKVNVNMPVEKINNSIAKMNEFIRHETQNDKISAANCKVIISGPFSQIPQNYTIVDTAGFGENNEFINNITLKEIAEAAKIYVVTNRENLYKKEFKDLLMHIDMYEQPIDIISTKTKLLDNFNADDEERKINRVFNGCDLQHTRLGDIFIEHKPVRSNLESDKTKTEIKIADMKLTCEKYIGNYTFTLYETYFTLMFATLFVFGNLISFSLPWSIILIGLWICISQEEHIKTSTMGPIRYTGGFSKRVPNGEGKVVAHKKYKFDVTYNMGNLVNISGDLLK